MSTYPTASRGELITWASLHVPVFGADPEAIGMTEAQAAAFAGASQAAAAAVAAQRQAYQAAMIATMAAKDAVRALREQCGSAVRSIRAFADTQPQPNEIYYAAQISQPDSPSPTPPPAQPQRLSVTLGAMAGRIGDGASGNGAGGTGVGAVSGTSVGSITLRWKCKNPSGTSGTTYLIRRRLPGETGFTFIGATGKKAFVDTTLPVGTANAEYTVQGQRGSRVGLESNIYTMHIGALPPPATATAPRTTLSAA